MLRQKLHSRFAPQLILEHVSCDVIKSSTTKRIVILGGQTNFGLLFTVTNKQAAFFVGSRWERVTTHCGGRGKQ